MICRTCGKQIDQGAAVCTGCGMMAGKGDRFCHNCGVETRPEQDFCIKCGVKLHGAGSSEYDWLTTLLLAIFAGTFGVHRFYTGHIAIGVVQLLTGGGCGIWYLVDIVLIATGQYTDSEGRALKRS